MAQSEKGTGFSIELLNLISESNCTLWAGDVQKTEPFNAVENTIYTIKCNAGWAFSDVATVTNDVGCWGTYQGSGRRYYPNQWNIAEDRKSAWIKFGDVPSKNTTNPFYTYYHYLDIEVVQTAPVDIVGGVNNIYKVDEEVLKTLTRERFFKSISPAPGAESVITYDFGQYIINLNQIPFKLPESVVLEPDFIQMATLETSTKAPVLSTDKINFDFGVITSPAFNDVLDYNIVNVLHLPFADPITIDNIYFVGKSLRVNLELNPYSGMGTYNVYSGDDEKSFLTVNTQIGINVPMVNQFSLATDNILSGSPSWSGDNKIRQPFIQQINSNSVLNKEFFNAPVMDAGELSGVSGWAIVDNIKLSSNATRSEKDMLINILKSGVIYD